MTSAKGQHKEPASAARKARAAEMLALGVPVAEVAEKLGVKRKTVDNWRTDFSAQILEAAEARMDAVTETVADTSAKARARIAARVDDAASTLLGLLEFEEGHVESGGRTVAVGAQAARVRLDAAKLVLALGGLVPISKNEHSLTSTNDETAARLAAALAAKDRT